MARRSATPIGSEPSPTTSRERGPTGNDVVVVVSAMGKFTDDLIRLADDVSPTRPPRELDMLLTAGERISMALVSMALGARGVESASFTGSQAGIITDTDHTRAKILEMRPDRIREALDAGLVPVVAGFQGVSTDRDITTLGRGGSDVTAVALAAALKADVCEIYTDVTGVFSADPRVVDEGPSHPEGLLRRDVGDLGHGRSRLDAALGRVRATPRRTDARSFEFHLGARHLDRGGGPHHGRSRRIGRDR